MFDCLYPTYPVELLRAYWKHYKLKNVFPWQIECLTKKPVIQQNKNLIFSAPTSAGKSLVADLLFLRPLLQSRADLMQQMEVDEELRTNSSSSEKPVSIFIVPYLSLITEKENKIKDLFKDLELTSASIHSHKRALLSESSPPDVVFCTI